MKEFFMAETAGCIYLLIVLIMSLVLFAVMGWDKHRARIGGRRVPEARLFLLALLGGGAGGWAGMYWFRHKTKHMKFVILFPLISIIQISGLVYLFIIK